MKDRYFTYQNRILPYHLQYFAKDGPGGEKTEPATAKKLSDARNEGQVVKSKELNSAIALIVLFLILKYLSGMIGMDFIETFTVVYKKIPDYVTSSVGGMQIHSVTTLLNNMILRIAQIVLPVFLIGFVMAFLVEIIQVKWKPTTKPLEPKFDKMDPLKGFKRMFSAESLAELIKSIFKIGIITYVAYSTLKEELYFIYRLYDLNFFTAIGLIGEMVINLGLKISIVYLFIGIGDYVFQLLKFKRDMKMTKQEVKDEFKNTEGNPEIKSRIRGKMREASRRRMMQAVPTADVIITNPTHFAVALKYDTEVSKAPIVIAKGEDFLAQKIREAAKENSIEIVENKPLARMLYYNVNIGAEIPPELYQAVAEVLAYVYNLKHEVNN